MLGLILKSQYISTTDAAKMLGVSIATVQQMVEANKLDAWKTSGGHRRITLESVNKVLNKESSIQPPAEGTLLLYIVEDDTTLLKGYEKLLQKFNLALDVRTFDNGLDAMFQIGVRFPDVLLLDLELPFIDGYELLNRLDNHNSLLNQHIIVITGLSEAEVKNKLARFSSISVIQKPPSPAFLEGYLRAISIVKR